MLKTSLRDTIWSLSQIILIASIISIAFSYNVNSQLELPYQVFMLIFTLSSYAMILQVTLFIFIPFTFHIFTNFLTNFLKLIFLFSLELFLVSDTSSRILFRKTCNIS